MSSPPFSTVSSDQHKPTNPFPSDTWSESATATLINAWGTHFLELNRGKLTHTHWLSVADSVNSIHPNHRPKTHVQCQNRIDTLKKRFKILVGGNTKKKPRRLKSHSPENSPSPEGMKVAEWKVPVGPRMKKKYEVVSVGDGEEGRWVGDGIDGF